MKVKVGIIGAGRIAGDMAKAMQGIQDQVVSYAIASRDLEKAQEFAAKWGFEKAYGSYEEMLQDPDLDLVYVATPHSHHYEHAKMCLEHGKAALVEKAFTANVSQTMEIIELAGQKKLLLVEAMWTRFLPAREIVKKVLADGLIGEITGLEADFSIPLTHKRRMWDPELAGGALLDLGVYALTFASMYWDEEIVNVETTCEKYETGVDATDRIEYTYASGIKATMKTSFVEGPVNEGIIHGTKGSLKIKDLNNYSDITRYDADGNEVCKYEIPTQVNGYEYEMLACVKALHEGKLECEEMPHSKTIEIMKQMDALRAKWDMVYPFEK